MRGTKTIIASCLLLAGSLAWGKGEEYFPLEPGNSWTYRSEGPRGLHTELVEVLRTQTFFDRVYYQLNLFRRQAFVRFDDQGVLWEYDMEAKQERPWFHFNAADRETHPSAFDQCVSGVTNVGRAEHYEGPFGTFDHALKVTFKPSCADAGLTEAWFLPYIGMIRYVRQTIAGPRVYDLVHSKTGLTEVATPLVSTRLTLDKVLYHVIPGSEGLAKLSIRNTSSATPLVLDFVSGQRVDMNIRNEENEIVYVWSADKLFIQATGTEVIGPGERNFVMQFPIDRLRPGRYVAEAWLTNVSKIRQYSATVAFEVAEVAPAETK